MDGTAAHNAPLPAARAHLAVLDGWRAISILLVLACHMLPLGPKAWQLNATAGPAGMSLFFTLSGFLIAWNLWKNSDVLSFFIRRLARIMPLAMIGATAFLALQGTPLASYPPHLLLYLNYDLQHVTDITSHFWSLCVEVHFYIAAGTIVLLLGRNGLVLLPLLAIAVTAYRVHQGAALSIVTHLRVDEILTGATLALVWLGQLGTLGRLIARSLSTIHPLIYLAVFAASCHPDSGPLQYLRPYLGTATVGACLLVPRHHVRLLTCRPMKYIADISYALYVVHPATMHGWLGSGDTLERYLKRPLCFAITFGLAHLSTFYMEHPINNWARRWTERRTKALPHR